MLEQVQKRIPTAVSLFPHKLFKLGVSHHYYAEYTWGLCNVDVCFSCGL